MQPPRGRLGLMILDLWDYKTPVNLGRIASGLGIQIDQLDPRNYAYLASIKRGRRIISINPPLACSGVVMPRVMTG